MVSFSVCIIAKNESENISRCIASLKNLLSDFCGSEVIVVDTGSEDDTSDIALRCGAKVYEHKWNGSFSDARNYAASRACNNIILALDCDEFLIDYDHEHMACLADALCALGSTLGKVDRIDEYEHENGELDRKHFDAIRIYDKRLYEFRGAIHENIERIDPGLAKTKVFSDIPLTFLHVGYRDPQTRRKKAIRDKELLLKDSACDEDPYILYQIGKCDVALGNHTEAHKFYEKAIDKTGDFRPAYVREMITSYGYTFLETGRATDALKLEQFYDSYCNYADYMFMLGLIYMNNARFEDAVNAFLNATTASEFSVEGVNSYKAFYNIGVIYEVLGDIPKAIGYYQKCGNYVPALNRIGEVTGTRVV